MLHFNAAAVKNNVKCHQRPQTNTAFVKQQAWSGIRIFNFILARGHDHKTLSRTNIHSEPKTSHWCCCKDNDAKDLLNLLNYSSVNVQYSVSKALNRKREKSVDKGVNI